MPDTLPRLEPVGAPPARPAAVVLVLHGGQAHSTESGERKGLAYRRMLPFARDARPRAAWPSTCCGTGCAGGTPPRATRCSTPGGPRPRWPSGTRAIPVVLLGHSMGGRAALGAAGAPNVTAVCALAPWLDGSDPVAQLAGRTVLIAHGDRERYTDPAASYAYAVRAKAAGVAICRFDLPGAGHFMLTRLGDWNALVRRFVLGVTGIEPLDPVIANALAQPAPQGLTAQLEEMESAR